MLRWDRELEDWIAAHRIGFLDPLAEALTYVGTWGLVWLVIALVLAVRSRHLAVLGWTLTADVLAHVTSNALKAATDRARPDVEALVGSPSTSSFPSGHAASSFACATVLAAFAPSLRLPLFVLAGGIAVSRAYVGVHFPLDVLAGAVLGLAVGAFVLRALRPLAAGLRRSRPAPRRG
ncbi:MAG TPA: phosphatase PAP2 family protein [Gaiellaceae bacterium]|jgi:undecaprenyl-diphosphatase